MFIVPLVVPIPEIPVTEAEVNQHSNYPLIPQTCLPGAPHATATQEASKGGIIRYAGLSLARPQLSIKFSAYLGHSQAREIDYGKQTIIH